MADPLALAEKIAAKAANTLDPLEREMKMAKWPAEFRVIMWQAIGETATRLAAEAGKEDANARR